MYAILPSCVVESKIQIQLNLLFEIKIIKKLLIFGVFVFKIFFFPLQKSVFIFFFFFIILIFSLLLQSAIVIIMLASVDLIWNCLNYPDVYPVAFVKIAVIQQLDVIVTIVKRAFIVILQSH